MSESEKMQGKDASIGLVTFTGSDAGVVVLDPVGTFFKILDTTGVNSNRTYHLLNLGPSTVDFDGDAGGRTGTIARGGSADVYGNSELKLRATGTGGNYAVVVYSWS